MSHSDYGFGSRLLHRIALASPIVAQSSFDLEMAMKRAKDSCDDRHVFITGLARAGTTILLRALHKTGKFRSLTYRDMPFVLMPNLWKQLSKTSRKHQDAKERAHGDNILVDFDSPEAFEEVFWRTFCGKDYILSDHLRPHMVDDVTIELFRQFVMQVVASADTTGQTRYLSKNNNNILRLSTIKKAFPNATILIPFRNPIQQAYSLLTQHRQFSERHKNDRFSYDYMCWLGHYEFGLTQKPFKFNTGLLGAEHNPMDINYWLRMWCNAYEYVLSTMSAGLILVSYENLCSHSTDMIDKILSLLDMQDFKSSMKTSFSAATMKEVRGVNQDLKDEALALYRRMAESS